MAAILSSPHIVPAVWGMDEAQLLSSPVARDAPLLNELDHSFGSSMSISSLDSPGRGPPRPRVTTTTRDVLTEDPFTLSPSAAMRAPQPELWGTRNRIETSYPKSSPHAMEISSPAAFQAVSAPAPAPAALVHPVRQPLSRRTDPTVRRSLPQLPSETELHSLSPPHEPPMKRRLSSLRQLQRASDPLMDQRLTQSGDEDAKDARDWNRDRVVRTHGRSQSVCLDEDADSTGYRMAPNRRARVIFGTAAAVTATCTADVERVGGRLMVVLGASDGEASVLCDGLARRSVAARHG